MEDDRSRHKAPRSIGEPQGITEAMIAEVEGRLLPVLRLASRHPHEPVDVDGVPVPWRLIGTGNYAAVLEHPDYAGSVVKIYAPGRPGIGAETEVYRRLGKHPAYSECFYDNVKLGCLILKKLRGVTLYDCFRKGIPIHGRCCRTLTKRWRMPGGSG